MSPSFKRALADQRMLADCVEVAARLSERERGFFDSLDRRRGFRLTDKQRAWLKQIHQRVRA